MCILLFLLPQPQPLVDVTAFITFVYNTLPLCIFLLFLLLQPQPQVDWTAYIT